VLLSEGSCEFGERGRDSAMLPDVDTEFVVAAANVLHERVTAHDHSGGAGAFESAHRSESGFEAAVVGFDPIVRVLLGVVERGRHEVLDRRAQRRRAVDHDLHGRTVSTECGLEEPARCRNVTFRRDVHVNDLAVLIDGAVDVSPPAGDLDVCLVHEPTVADGVATGSGRVREQRCEALDHRNTVT
jgi:hypothetical protein